MKEGLERLMKSLTARIEGLEKKQTDQDAMIKENQEQLVNQNKLILDEIKALRDK